MFTELEMNDCLNRSYILADAQKTERQLKNNDTQETAIVGADGQLGVD